MTVQPNPEAEPVNAPAQTRAAKARLLLNLIKTGAIPPPSAEFILELSQRARSDATPEGSDVADVLKSLGQHLSTRSQSPGPAKGTIERDDSPTDAPTNMQQEAAQALGKTDVLGDQHPAVIYQEIGKLSQDDLKLQLKALPGKTARQVAFLSWQRG